MVNQIIKKMINKDFFSTHNLNNLLFILLIGITLSCGKEDYHNDKSIIIKNNNSNVLKADTTHYEIIQNDVPYVGYKSESQTVTGNNNVYISNKPSESLMLRNKYK